jgi:hypothetical protein
MSAHYRLVHFAPDPFSGWRVPIGALVGHADDRPMFVQANWVPGPGCLGAGGEATAAVLRMIVAAIARAPNLQRLPVEAGPHAVLSEALPIPTSVADPALWLAHHVLPGRVEGRAKLPEREFAIRREVVGRRFFEQHKVDRWVKRKLNPRFLGQTISRLSASEITHYVAGTDQLLLLEPVVATRQDFDKNVAKVNQLFLAWRQLFGEAPKSQTPQTPRFIAYTFPFGLRDRVANVRDVLARHRFEVVDVDAPGEREGLLNSVRQVGLSGETVSSIH